MRVNRSRRYAKSSMCCGVVFEHDGHYVNLVIPGVRDAHEEAPLPKGA
jgi:hypothetical protein